MTLHSDIPEDMLDDFTMKGQISLRYDVKDDRTPKVCESGRARYLEAMAAVAPVRYAVISVASITASG